MSQHVVKLECDDEACYLLWSTATGSLLAGPFDKIGMRAWLLRSWGLNRALAIEKILADAEQFGTSDQCFERRGPWDTLSNNRAGLDGSRLNLDQILDVLVRGRPNVKGEGPYEVPSVLTGNDPEPLLDLKSVWELGSQRPAP